MDFVKFSLETFRYVDRVLLVVVAILIVFGIIGIYSGGYYTKTREMQYIKQIIWVIIGIVFGFLFFYIDYRHLISFAPAIYGLGILSLVAVLLFGQRIRNVKGWFYILGMGIQPAIIFMLPLILMLTWLYTREWLDVKSWKTSILTFLIVGFPSLLVLLQPDLGTILVYVFIMIIMMFVAGLDIEYLLYIFSASLSTIVYVLLASYGEYLQRMGSPSEVISLITSKNFLIPISILLLVYGFILFILSFFIRKKILRQIGIVLVMVALGLEIGGFGFSKLKDYQKRRIIVFINPEFDKLGAGYNIIQSEIAVGSGKLFGKGILQGSQNKYGFLPEKTTDFVFAVLAEETGFLGSITIILLFFILFYRLLVIGLSSPYEGALIVFGVFAMYFAHFMINIGMVLGILPVTGLPLPFISYGGSSIITNLSALGLVLNIYARRYTIAGL